MRKRLLKKLMPEVIPQECPGCGARDRELERLRGVIEGKDGQLRAKDDVIRSLRQALDESRRAGKRQAAPFSKGDPKPDPKRPGRKPGKDYGTKAHRPQPGHADEVLEAPLPPECPHCKGPIEEDSEIEDQFLTELPPIKPHVTQFRIHVGHCIHCLKRIQGRHPRQTSDALGAAASMIGPRATALAADLNKDKGISFGKVSRFFLETFDLTLSRAGVYVAATRVARVTQPTYHAMIEWIREAPIVSPDETGWKVGGLRAWLWAFVSESLTVYAIRQGRGYAEAAEILGEHFSGTLVRDGYGVYPCFLDAIHQTCNSHLLRRCRELLEVAQRGAARVPTAVSRILKRGLELRDRRDARTITPLGLAVEQGKLEARLDRLLTWQPTDEENRKLLEHLRNERAALFRYLLDPAVPATNHWAERAIRPAVVTRKSCGGNRTWVGAHVQEVIASFFRTARQQGRNPLDMVVDLLRSPQPQVATVLAPAYVLAAQRNGRPAAPS